MDGLAQRPAPTKTPNVVEALRGFPQKILQHSRVELILFSRHIQIKLPTNGASARLIPRR